MASPTSTVIYLDIDGVLNVGIRDRGTAPLLLNDTNQRMARDVADPSSLPRQERECVERVNSVASKSIGKADNGTYSSFACRGAEQVAGPLVARLAEIIQAAGDPCVVLASNWRKPKYQSKVRRLEEGISKQLGYDFTFGGATGQVNEKDAVDRLRCIGEHLNAFCSELEPSTALRVVVLDDFFVTPLDGWTMECGSRIASTADVESYLYRCAELPGVNVKMVHCYTDWVTNGGLKVQVGTGLTAACMRVALGFLNEGSHMTGHDSNKCVDLIPISARQRADVMQSVDSKRSGSSHVQRLRTMLSKAMPRPTFTRFSAARLRPPSAIKSL